MSIFWQEFEDMLRYKGLEPVKKKLDRIIDLLEELVEQERIKARVM